MGFKNRFLLRRKTGLPANQKESSEKEATGTVVIADAEPADLDHLSRMLEQLGYRALGAADGETALKLARQHRPLLVMASLQLPGLDGYKLCQRLREEKETENTPFMFICGPGEHPDRVIGHETFAHDYIQKPVSTPEFRSRVHAVIKSGGAVKGAVASADASPAVRGTGPQKGAELVDHYLREFKGMKSSAPPARKAPADAATERDLKAEPLELPVDEATLSRELPEWKVDLYRETELYVLASFRRVVGKELPEVAKGLELVRRIIDSVASGTDLLLAATERTEQFRLTGHCANVAILAIKVGLNLDYAKEQLERLGLAALLHDVGAVRIPRELFYQKEKPSAAETRQLRMLPGYGAQILEALGSDYSWLQQIVEQVCEREDGSGFPKGLTGDQICEEAKMIGAVVLFEAATHYRPYRPWVTGFEALFELTAESGAAFSDRIVKSLIKAFSVYPYNEYVILSSGEVGVVRDINSENAFRPKVAILYDSRGDQLPEPRLTDLTQDPSLSISKAITPDQLVIHG